MPSNITMDILLFMTINDYCIYDCTLEDDAPDS